MKGPPSDLSTKPDRGARKLIPELSSRPEEIMYYPHLTFHQSAPNMSPDPQSTVPCDFALHDLLVTGHSGAGSFRAQTHLTPDYCAQLLQYMLLILIRSFLHCKLAQASSFDQCTQANGLTHWALVTVPKQNFQVYS